MDLMQGTGRDISRGEAVEGELDAFISRRASRAPDPDEQEELWKTSVRAHNARLRDENRAAWCDYHRGQADALRRTLEELITRHEAEAERLMQTERREQAS